jgi:hypothetical protein
MPAHPPPPYPPAPGRAWVPVIEDPREWKVVEPRRPCRTVIGRHVECGQPGAAALNRGRTVRGAERVDAWWGYCTEHLTEFGRWVDDGRVWRWVQVDETEDFFGDPAMEVR